MNQEDKILFATMMAGIAELHGKKLSTQLLEIYWRCLIEYQIDDIKTALKYHAIDPDCGQFMPKPADIVRMLVGNSSEQSLQVWSTVLKATQSVGCYKTIVFDNSIIHAVINEMGGWVKLCQTLEDSLPFTGKEFQKRYQFYLRQQTFTYPNKLVGIIEHTNAFLGHSIELPVLFGDKTTALRIYHEGKNHDHLPLTQHSLNISSKS